MHTKHDDTDFLSYAYLTADTIQMTCFDRHVLFLPHLVLSLLYLNAALCLQGMQLHS